MKHLTRPLAASLVLSLSVLTAKASVLDSATTADASHAQLYGVFHDTATNYVFVKLPQGWVFAGKDDLAAYHEVFLDASTQFVFVKLSSGWKFLAKAKE